LSSAPRPSPGACSIVWRESDAPLHILDGFAVAFLNLDEVIRIIRREDEPKPVLMKRFRLSDEQDRGDPQHTSAHLAKLEEMKIREEQKTLAAERGELEALLKSKAKLKKLIATEIRADADKYGDERRTKIIEREAAQAIDATTLIPNEPVTVVLSTGGWVRSAKGHDIGRAPCPTRAGTRSRRSPADAACSRHCSSTAPAAPTRCRRTRLPPPADTASRSPAGSILRTARNSPA